MNKLRINPPGAPVLAGNWTTSPRIDDLPQCGTFLVLDRSSRRWRYTLERHHDFTWDDDRPVFDDMEVQVWEGEIAHLENHLSAVVWEWAN